jgi:transcriptional regulator with XRE-family HTH domain
MKLLQIGQIIRDRRLELGLTQEKVCEGICDPVTLSRIENGRQTPSKSKLNVLLQRLGLPQENYYAMVSEHEVEISKLQKEILACNVLENANAGLEKIDRLESLLTPEDTIEKQFVLRSRVILGKRVDGRVQPYTPEERLELLDEAIRMTVPNFDLKKLKKRLYGTDEIKIIHQIALAQWEQGNKETALELFQQLMAVCGNSFQESRTKEGVFTLIAYNYARVLCIEKEYEESLVVAQKGRDASVAYGQYHTLAGTIAVMAEDYYRLGVLEKSKECYYEAYYLLKAVKDEKNAQILKNDAEVFLNLKIV